MASLHRPSLIVAGAAVLICSLSLQAQTVPDFIRKYEKDGLPSTSALPLDPTRGVPVPVEELLADVTVSVKDLPTTEQETAEARGALAVANASPTLKSTLGSRSRLLGGGVLPRSLDATGQDAARYLFTFYDYDRERAVEAQVKGTVVDVKVREAGYQPAASAEEIFAAANSIRAFDDPIASVSLRGLAYAGSDGKRRLFLFGQTSQRTTTATVEMATQRASQVRSVERQR